MTRFTLRHVPAGYSSTPLPRKIGVKDGHHLVLWDPPDAWTIDGLPSGVRFSLNSGLSEADVVLAFFRDLVTLQREVPLLAPEIGPDAALWLAWPRRAGGHRSDITDNAIRAAVLPLGLVDVKVAALDDDWSGLQMVWRKDLRESRLMRLLPTVEPMVWCCRCSSRRSPPLTTQCHVQLPSSKATSWRLACPVELIPPALVVLAPK